MQICKIFYTTAAGVQFFSLSLSLCLPDIGLLKLWLCLAWFGLALIMWITANCTSSGQRVNEADSVSSSRSGQITKSTVHNGRRLDVRALPTSMWPPDRTMWTDEVQSSTILLYPRCQLHQYCYSSFCLLCTNKAFYADAPQHLIRTVCP